MKTNNKLLFSGLYIILILLTVISISVGSYYLYNENLKEEICIKYNINGMYISEGELINVLSNNQDLVLVNVNRTNDNLILDLTDGDEVFRRKFSCQIKDKIYKLS